MQVLLHSFLVFIIVSFSFNSKATNILLESKIPYNQKQIISNDLSVLDRQYYGSTKYSDPILKVLNLRTLTTRNMVKWLEDRVQIVISDTPQDKLFVQVLDDNYNFPYKNEFPELEMHNPENIINSVKSIKAKTATTVMSNIGSALYFSGKRSKKLFQMKFDNNYFIGSSPRVGIIMIGDGHFMEKFNIVKGNVNALPNSLNRLSTFFHEARHSDGHGKSLSFMHALCPKGHDYQFLNACDRNLNGPYTVGALVTKQFIKNCSSCKIEEKEALKIKYLGSLNRVIRKTVVEGTSSDPYFKKLIKYRELYREGIRVKSFKEEDLAKAKNNLKLLIEAIKQEKLRLGIRDYIKPSVYWNASPEGRRR